MPPFPKEEERYLDVEFGFGGAGVCYGGHVSGTAILRKLTSGQSLFTVLKNIISFQESSSVDQNIIIACYWVELRTHTQ